MVYEKESEEMKQKLNETRRKEWANRMKYSDGVWIDEKQLKEMQAKQPSLRVMPTRWVEVDKSEVGQKEQLKSRFVLRGNLNDFDVSKSGEKMGFRSQSGRVICLGHQSFQHDHRGQLMLMEWHSTTIKRVCRSSSQRPSVYYIVLRRLNISGCFFMVCGKNMTDVIAIGW